jgi:diaminohydroxyphosphoribosylaminopyrimidine deaminase/5-amino-6-(5-phosphoribosylamino)uracil reductase
LLTDRSGLPRRRRLLRVILDTKLRLPIRSRIVKSSEHDLLVFTAASLQSPTAKRLQAARVELARVPAQAGKLNLKVILRALGAREVQNAMLECGPRLNGAALSARIVDRVVLFYAPKISGHTKTPFYSPAQPEFFSFRQKSFREYGPDFAVDALLHDPFDS